MDYCLDEDEILEFNLINSKFELAEKSLQKETLDAYDFSDEELIGYLQAVYNMMMEAKYLDLKFIKKLQEKLNLGKSYPIINKDYVVVGKRG